MYPVFPQQQFVERQIRVEQNLPDDETSKYFHSDSYSLAQLEVLFGRGTVALAATCMDRNVMTRKIAIESQQS